MCRLNVSVTSDENQPATQSPCIAPELLNPFFRENVGAKRCIEIHVFKNGQHLCQAKTINQGIKLGQNGTLIAIRRRQPAVVIMKHIVE